MEDMELSGIVGTVIMQVRRRWPQIDGLYVLLIAALVSAFLVFLSAPAEWKTTLPARAIKVFGMVAGGFSLAGYAASKVPSQGGAG